MTDKPTGKKPVLPEVQAASDELMLLHGRGDKTQESSFRAFSAVHAAGDAIMKENPMMRAEYAVVELLVLLPALAPILSRMGHFLAADINRKYGYGMPTPRPYDPEYDPESVTIEPAKVKRR
jgi:hypothetical protein